MNLILSPLFIMVLTLQEFKYLRIYPLFSYSLWRISIVHGEYNCNLFLSSINVRFYSHLIPIVPGGRMLSG